MNSGKDIGVIICRCRGKISEKIDFNHLKKFLKGYDGISFIDVVDELCTDPAVLKTRHAKSLVIAGCSNSRHIDRFKDILEGTRIPVFACEFINIRDECAQWHDSILKATECAKLIIKAYIEKANAASEVAENVKAAGIKEVIGTRKESISRRRFLRLPLMLANIITHHEELPLIDQNRCIAAESPCRSCINICPFDALVIKNSMIAVLENRCEKCGLCASFCPLDAIQMPTFSISQALRLVDSLADQDMKINNRFVIFTCDKGREEIDASIENGSKGSATPIIVRVPCVASLSPTVLIRSLELGFDAVICLCPDKHCKRKKAFIKWHESMDSFYRILEATGITPSLATLVFDKEKVNPAISSIYENVLSEHGPHTLSQHPTSLKHDTRTDLINILKAMAKNKAQRNVCLKDLQLPFFDIKIDGNKCDMCGACVRQCPTKALQMVEDEEIYIRFSCFDCVGCSACVSKCPEEAISIERSMDLWNLIKKQFVTKATDEFVKCNKCGKRIGKRKFLENVERKLKNRGFAELASRVYSCQDCKNLVLHDGDEKYQIHSESLQ